MPPSLEAPPGLAPTPGLEGPPGLSPPARVDLVQEMTKSCSAAFAEELSRSVREDVDAQMAQAAEVLWDRGRQAVRNLEQLQVERTAKLEGELRQCVEAQKALEQENEELKGTLTDIARRLAHLGAGPPTIPNMGPSFRSDGESSTRFHTPVGSPVPAPESLSSPWAGLPSVPAFPNGGMSPSPEALAAMHGGMDDGSNTYFHLTLRRADDVPLGLDVSSGEDGPWLTVESVRSGGAVEAWNRQCSNEVRAIIAGDRIISVNGVEEAQGMREECRTKRLLRIVVSRSLPSNGSDELQEPKGNGAEFEFKFNTNAEEFVPS